MEQVELIIEGGAEGLQSATHRYDLLGRVRDSARRQHVTFLAFGFASHSLRMVLDGSTHDIGTVIRGVKVGTTHSLRHVGVRLTWGVTRRTPIPSSSALQAVVAWCHQASDAPGTDPLVSPWTSHRDLMGFRFADFIDVDLLRARVSARRIHSACDGRALPKNWPATQSARDSLHVLLRIAGSTLGVLPANPRCFRLFVHLARATGWQTRHISQALNLTARRVRQLAALPEPHLTTAMVAITDPRLRRVP